MNIMSMSGSELARCFGVDRSMVSRWKKAGMPHLGGLFCLPDCIRWRLDQAEAELPAKAATPEGERWLTAFRRERAKTARLERFRLGGGLVSKEEVKAMWLERFGEARQAMLSLPNRVPEECREQVKGIVRQILEALSRPGKYCPIPDKENIKKEKDQ